MRPLGIVFLVVGIVVAAVGLSKTSDGEFIGDFFPQTLLALNEHYALERYNIALKYQNLVEGGDQKVADSRAAYDDLRHEREEIQREYFGAGGCLVVLGLVLLAVPKSRSSTEKYASTYLGEMNRIKNEPEAPSLPVESSPPTEPTITKSLVPRSAQEFPRSNFEDKLRKLAEWRGTGLITETDYDKQKATLLNKFTGGT